MHMPVFESKANLQQQNEVNCNHESNQIINYLTYLDRKYTFFNLFQ